MISDMIKMVGLYLLNFTIHLHNMESVVNNNNDFFSYWKLVAKSIMIDHQQSSTKIIQIQDTPRLNLQLNKPIILSIALNLKSLFCNRKLKYTIFL